MAMIMTGAKGALAYWEAGSTARVDRAFRPDGTFLRPLLRSFAGLSAFAANGNHPPADFDGAVSWDAGVDLLFRIAGKQ